MKPVKQCNKPSCFTLIPFDVDYCAQHTHMRREKHHRYDTVRNREDKQYREIYHSTRWRKLRRQVLLRDDYMCLACLKEGRYRTAEVADHIVELRDDISKAYDMDNLQSLCHECHNRKTRQEAERRKQES